MTSVGGYMGKLGLPYAAGRKSLVASQSYYNSLGPSKSTHTL